MNPARLAALQPRPDELKGLGMPAAEVAKIQQRAEGCAKRVEQAVAALKPAADGKWVHVELGLPYTTPSDGAAGSADVVSHKNATVLFDRGDGKSVDVFQTGEMIQVGRAGGAWRLIDGPLPGSAPGRRRPGRGRDGRAAPRAFRT